MKSPASDRLTGLPSERVGIGALIPEWHIPSSVSDFKAVFRHGDNFGMLSIIGSFDTAKRGNVSSSCTLTGDLGADEKTPCPADCISDPVS